MLNELSLFTIAVGIAQIIGTIVGVITIVLNKDKIFEVIRDLHKFLIDKNQSIGSKIHHLKEQILLSSVEIIKMILWLSSLLLTMRYFVISDKNRCGLYGFAIPNLKCESVINTDLLWVATIFLFYFICLSYVFGHEKKEIKKMDDDFVPYPIKIEDEKKAGEMKFNQD